MEDESLKFKIDDKNTTYLPEIERNNSIDSESKN